YFLTVFVGGCVVVRKAQHFSEQAVELGPDSNLFLVICRHNFYLLRQISRITSSVRRQSSRLMSLWVTKRISSLSIPAAKTFFAVSFRLNSAVFMPVALMSKTRMLVGVLPILIPLI